MELARAAGPLSAARLAERTLLSPDAVEAALSELVEADLCSVLPGDERRPDRYETAVEPEPDV
jgi:DNA-binding IscR family transcriptional regulator